MKTPKCNSVQFIYSVDIIYLIIFDNLLANDTIYCNEWYKITYQSQIYLYDIKLLLPDDSILIFSGEIANIESIVKKSNLVVKYPIYVMVSLLTKLNCYRIDKFLFH